MDLSGFWEALRPMWLVWLVILFGGIVFWAFRPKNKQRFRDDAMIPFKNDNGGG